MSEPNTKDEAEALSPNTLLGGFGRIVKQEPHPGGIKTTYEGGEVVDLPYEVDGEGNEFIDLDPNGEMTNT